MDEVATNHCTLLKHAGFALDALPAVSSATNAGPAAPLANKYCQSRDEPSLFVLGSYVFPQKAGRNPTATVGALACWTAEVIAEDHPKRLGALV